MKNDDFFDGIRQFMEEKDGKRAVIVGFECQDWDHWTVIQSISPRRMRLFDSSRMKTVDIKRCTLTMASRERPYFIDREEVFFLSAKQGKRKE